MNIQLCPIKVKDLCKDYTDLDDDGVVGYGGLLDIRPPYQREFVYDDEQRKAVIDTVMNGFPLNVMYWAVRDDIGYEIIDGQQRTISICQYVNGDFSYNGRFYHSLQDDEKQKIDEYELMVYQCSGTPSAKLKWFEIINIAGVELTKQELKNAQYYGPWLSDAKKYFSKSNCPGYDIGKHFIKGNHRRQEYLEVAIDWLTIELYSNEQLSKDERIKNYMSSNQFNNTAIELWNNFTSTTNWARSVFKTYYDDIRGLNWGLFYHRYKMNSYDPQLIDNRIKILRTDDEITNRKGIYEYILSNNEKYLNLRSFTENQKMLQFNIQQGKCPHCKETYTYNQMEGDHITPWSQGGKTENSNIQMLCKDCNRRKSNH